MPPKKTHKRSPSPARNTRSSPSPQRDAKKRASTSPKPSKRSTSPAAVKQNPESDPTSPATKLQDTAHPTTPKGTPTTTTTPNNKTNTPASTTTAASPTTGTTPDSQQKKKRKKIYWVVPSDRVTRSIAAAKAQGSPPTARKPFPKTPAHGSPYVTPLRKVIQTRRATAGNNRNATPPKVIGTRSKRKAEDSSGTTTTSPQGKKSRTSKKRTPVKKEKQVKAVKKEPAKDDSEMERDEENEGSDISADQDEDPSQWIDADENFYENYEPEEGEIVPYPRGKKSSPRTTPKRSNTTTPSLPHFEVVDLPEDEVTEESLKELHRKRALVKSEITAVEKKIWSLEGSYLEDTVKGNVIKGFDFIGSRLRSGNWQAVKRQKCPVKPSDRLFSASSANYKHLVPAPGRVKVTFGKSSD
eukprot:TRINITY_DN68397_c0_g1_i1.p2 TRINITY_DN68397_c0_g1~~TRINITY_DN68397_c0_g1_i1.p2  ORF type:complete len:413 (-),score=64.36 TRINITY_DN68397_c0_g1_i1:1919-3157(-)